MGNTKSSSGSAIFDRLPPLCAKYTWLVAQNLETGDQFFYPKHDTSSQYHCRIPELIKNRIRAYFHGWVILSNHPQNDMWSLWNPVASKIISLPPLKDEIVDPESIKICFLSLPPDDPSSVLILITGEKPTMLVCGLDKRSEWKTESYEEQLKSIAGGEGFLHGLACYNGKIYALCNVRNDLVIQIDLVFKEQAAVMINLSPFVRLPFQLFYVSTDMTNFLKEHNGELFYVAIRCWHIRNTTPIAVYFYKLDTASMVFKEMEELKDAILFINGFSQHYIPSSHMGGYMHYLGEDGKVLYSYHVKDKTISISSMPYPVLPTTHVSVWECRLQDDHGEMNSKQEKDGEEDKIMISSTKNINPDLRHEESSHLFNIPFHTLEMIMKFCVGVEYLNFRATCKRCQLAAPVIKWSSKTASTRLKTYSLVSPWLMVFDKHKGIITFTDPLFGDKYFVKTPNELIANFRILCSRYGWLLLNKLGGPLMFFNPFTNDIRKLPSPLVPFLETLWIDTLCFSAPPTSPDCMVVGFKSSSLWQVCIYFVARDSSWRKYKTPAIVSGSGPSYFYPTFNGRDLYALRNEGEIDVIQKVEKDDRSWVQVSAKLDPRDCYGSSTQYLLTNCDRHQDLILIVMGKLGESIKVFKRNASKTEWEKIDNLGSRMIYISGATCLCMEAKTPEMENKIYFPRLHSQTDKIVFYSLETSKYHIHNGRFVQEISKDFLGTKYHLKPHVWIEPNWS